MCSHFVETNTPIFQLAPILYYKMGCTTLLEGGNLSHLGPDLCSKYSCTRITTVGQSQLPWFKMVFNTTCALQKSESARLVPVFPGRSRYMCWGRFMARGILSEFDTTHRAVVLAATLVLPIRTGTTAEVVKARCNNCSSKLCLLFSPFEPRSLQQIPLHKNDNCGTATS